MEGIKVELPVSTRIVDGVIVQEMQTVTLPPGTILGPCECVPAPDFKGEVVFVEDTGRPEA